MARLSIINNGKLVKTVELGAGELYIGRGDDVSIQLKHPLISRKHARVYLTSAGYVVEDQGTKNGTFVKGRRVMRHRLDDADELEIADFILRYHADGFVPVDSEIPDEDKASLPSSPGGQKSPLEAYMEALKRGGSNATAAIPPEAMAKLREQARRKATPRIQVGDQEPVPFDQKVVTAGWSSKADLRLPGWWFWVSVAVRLVREDADVVVERGSFLVPIKKNGDSFKGGPIVPGDMLEVAGKTISLLEGDPGF